MKNINIINKKFILSIIFFLYSINFTSALQIVTVDYSTNKNCRFVKVLNNEEVSIVITDYKLLDSTASSTGHSITLVSLSLDKEIAIGEEAIISNGDKLCSFSSFSGKVFHSAISTATAIPTFIDIKAPSTKTTTTTSTSTSGDVDNTSDSESEKTIYSSDKRRGTYSLGDLAILAEREKLAIAGASTQFWIKAIDSKKSNPISNVYWSFGDGAEGVGVTTTHRYLYPGYYIATIDVDTNSAYGYERVNVKVIAPNIEISEVVNTNDDKSYVVIKNNSEEEIDIGGYIISMDTGMYRLSRHLILPKSGDVKIYGGVLGFKTPTNVKLLFQNNSPITSYIEKIATTTFVLSTSSIATSTNISAVKNINNKIVYKKIVPNKVSVASTTIKTLENKDISTNTKIIQEKTGEKGMVSGIRKWLYWLYE